MKKTFTRILATLLCFSMMMELLPTLALSVYADDGEIIEEQNTVEESPENDVDSPEEESEEKTENLILKAEEENDGEEKQEEYKEEADNIITNEEASE